MAVILTLVLSSMGILNSVTGQGINCPNCTDIMCPPPPPQCDYGYVTDICDCCQQCGQGVNETCGGPFDSAGKCGFSLHCVSDKPHDPNSEGKCGPIDPTLPSSCTQPPVSGPCEAYMPSYFYNVTSGWCERFVYGGCNGNGNRYETFDDCAEICMGTETTTEEELTITEEPVDPEEPEICEMSLLERILCLMRGKCTFSQLVTADC